MPMSHRDALEILAAHRGNHVVVTTMTSGGIFPTMSDSPLDFAYLPSSMGQGPSLGLGLALATGRGVVVVNGDGCMLMNLGCLVTLAHHPADVFVVVMANGIYEVTGGQPLAGKVDFAAIAKGAGISRAYTCADRAAWAAAAPEALAGRGPVLIALDIEPRYGQKTPKPPRPPAEQIARLRAGLGVS